MRTVLDGKFHGVVVKNKDQTIVPPDQWMILLAKDNAVPATLRFYYQECVRLGVGTEQLKSLNDLITRVNSWREQNPDKCKVPDTDPSELVL